METKKQEIESRDFSRSLGFLIHDVARLMRREFDRRVRHLGLTRSQWFLLAHLYRTDGQTQRKLADELDMERAPVSKLLDRLESGGWVKRRADPADRRANRIYITGKFEPLMAEAFTVGEKLTDDIMSGVELGSREQFLHILGRAKANLLAMEVDRHD